MCGDDLSHDGKSQTAAVAGLAAGFVRAVEGFENVRQLLLRDARSIIGIHEFGVFPLDMEGNTYFGNILISIFYRICK